MSLSSPLIWCAISGHGFGHAAQLIPVLNELDQIIPELRVILRTTVPAWFFDRLTLHWEYRPSQQDVGCIQRGPLWIDVPATWSAYDRFHTNWQKRVKQEAAQMHAVTPDLVLSNISHLGLAAGAEAGVPRVALCSLSWDQILKPFVHESESASSRQHAIIRDITDAYGQAELMIRPRPSIPMTAFPNMADVPPIALQVTSEALRLRSILRIVPDERIVLLAFGGISLESLPLEAMETMTGYRFLIREALEKPSSRIHTTIGLPFSFNTLLASADIVLTKPGYSTIVEAVASRRPVVYIRRNNFADEQSLVDYLLQFGRGVELSVDDFTSGHWTAAFEQVLKQTRPDRTPPPLNGAREAAMLIAKTLKRYQRA
jgi:hypothetical protein